MQPRSRFSAAHVHFGGKRWLRGGSWMLAECLQPRVPPRTSKTARCVVKYLASLNSVLQHDRRPVTPEVAGSSPVAPALSPSADTAIVRRHHADYPDRGVDTDQRVGGSYSATTSRITSVAADARG